MTDQWYYERATQKHGPYSSDRLRALAADGSIHLTDTIWKEGVDRGLVASKVKNLFPAALPAAMPAPPPLLAKDVPVAPADAAPAKPAEPPKKPVHQARAIAGRGLVIISQDGVNVWFKKKCFVCGFEDAMRAKMMIKRGANRMSFLCNKCRKMRDAEFQGIV